MLRYVVSLAILAIGLAWIAVGAPTGAGPDLLDPSPGEGDWEDCGPDAEECSAVIRERQRPTPAPPDPRVLEILRRDSMVQAMIGDLEPGTDYWVNVSPHRKPIHGDEGAMVTVVSTRPIDYSGSVPDASDPCAGRRVDEHVPAGDPCLEQSRAYGTRQVDFRAVNELHFQVDTKRGEVVSVFALSWPPESESVQQTIEYFQTLPGGGVVPLSAR